jgi:CubicO group peptidase (beta-lactamase class C family)
MELCQAFGTYSIGTEERFVSLDTLFDLASLTKVVSTLPAILTLAAGGKLALDDKVRRYIPAFAHDEVTIRHLLTHSSGLPADLPFVPRLSPQYDVLASVLEQPLVTPPDTAVMYSDLGMILLGEVIRVVSGLPLDVYVTEAVFRPLGVKELTFNPDAAHLSRIAPTEFVDGEFVHGAVHDEKCLHMGGVSGSAGLFGTAGELLQVARLWLEPERFGIIPPDDVRIARSHSFQNRGLGWEVLTDSDNAPYSCGTLWSQGSFGHTGFTGTSLWIDPVRELTVVFLTNAVHYGRGNSVKHLRRELHDTVYKALFHD